MRFVTHTLAPSKAIVCGPEPTGKLPSTAPSGKVAAARAGTRVLGEEIPPRRPSLVSLIRRPRRAWMSKPGALTDLVTADCVCGSLALGAWTFAQLSGRVYAYFCASCVSPARIARCQESVSNLAARGQEMLEDFSDPVGWCASAICLPVSEENYLLRGGCDVQRCRVCNDQ